MNIIISERVEPTYKELGNGELFEYYGDIYMKTNIPEIGGINPDDYYAVNLTNGTKCEFGKDVEVVRVMGELKVRYL